MEIASVIESTLLRPDVTEDQVRMAVMSASQLRLAAVTVTPVWARFAGIAAAESPVRVGVAVGYPLGTHTASAKGLEGRLALEEGAVEVTIVPNLSAYKSGRGEVFRQDIAHVIKQCRLVNADALIKVLLYGDLLEPAALREAVRVVQGHGGVLVLFGNYTPQPITPAMVREWLAMVQRGSPVGVMGEVRSWAEARPLLETGIARLATPWGLEIVQEAARRTG